MRVVVSGRAQKVTEYVSCLSELCVVTNCELPEAALFGKSVSVTAVCSCIGNHFPLQEMERREYQGLVVTVHVNGGVFHKGARRLRYAFERRDVESTAYVNTEQADMVCSGKEAFIDSEQDVDTDHDLLNYELMEDWEARVEGLGVRT